jgi:RNA polymerase sigma-70 factor (ECF subfamily)
MRGRGTPRDFDDWYRGEWPRLVAGLTLAAGDADLGRELAAEALARALERWSRVGAMDSPGGWTYRVGLNLLRRHHRRHRLERRALERSTDLRSMAAPGLDPELELRDAVASLPDRQRTVVALRYGADMTETQIAELLGIAPGTVSATLNHARVQLRRALDRTVGEVPHG